MACTTILVGTKASYDGSTMIARTDDGHFDIKKTIVVNPEDQKNEYTSVIGHRKVVLPDDPMRYTASPSVDPKNGIWAASGINAANVGMTATETITTNPRVLGADPYVVYQEKTDTAEQSQNTGARGRCPLRSEAALSTVCSSPFRGTGAPPAGELHNFF